MSRFLGDLARSLCVRLGFAKLTGWNDHGFTRIGFCYSLNESIPKGWYILSIVYASDDLRGYLRFRSRLGSYEQGLTTRPLIRRIRVVHVAHSGRPCLELESEDPRLIVRDLSLRKIPACQAWRLIYKKLKRSHPKYQRRRMSTNLANAWLGYNRLQSGRFHKTPLVAYRDWIRLVESRSRLMLKLAPRQTQVSKQPPCLFLYRSFADRDCFSPAPLRSWVIVLVQNQVVSENCEAELLRCIEQFPASKLIYSDYDRLSVTGTRYEPNFKPSLNLDLALSDPSYSIGCAIRADLWNESLANMSRYTTEQTFYGIFLEALYSACSAEVIHIAKVLFHLQDTPEVSSASVSDLRATQSSAQAVKSFCKSYHSGAEVDVHLVNQGRWGQRVTWPLPQRPILVSILMPTKDAHALLEQCVSSIYSTHAGINYELIVIDNGSTDGHAISLLDELSGRQGVTILQDPNPFNYSSLMNSAARSASGEVYCLLNNDTEVITPGWLAKLSAHALRPEIGCVGPMLLFADHTIQHGGIILGIGGIAGHAHKYMPPDSPGFQARLQLCHNLSAVTGACLVVRSSLWSELGGLDEHSLAVNYNDVDFCLKASSAGYRNLYVPSVRLYHYESKSRGVPTGLAYQQWQQESAVMLNRWASWIHNDPAYSPHLTLAREDFGISLRDDELIIRAGCLPA